MLSPLVPQLPQPREHGLGVGLFRQIGEGLAQAGDHAGVLQAHEGVDVLLLRQGGHHRLRGVVAAGLFQQLLGSAVAYLAVQGEFEVVFQIVVPGVEAGVAREFGNLLGEGLVEQIHVATVVHIAGTGVEHGVATEQGGLVGVGAQANVAQGVAGGVQALELHGFTHFHHVARAHAAVHARDFAFGFVVGNELGARGGYHGSVATSVVVVLVGVEYLGDVPAFDFGCVQGFFAVQRVDGQRLAGFGAGHQVAVIAQAVVHPNTFNHHGGVLIYAKEGAIVKSSSRVRFLVFLARCRRQMDVVCYKYYSKSQARLKADAARDNAQHVCT
jgi:hypothetical protein